MKQTLAISMMIVLLLNQGYLLKEQIEVSSDYDYLIADGQDEDLPIYI